MSISMLNAISPIDGAHKFSDKFAAKANFGWLKGTDWAATSEVDSDMIGGTRATNLNYNEFP